jgi:UDP-2,4-diacetamido-2,4,6-trideoxy-beta-L-altropyranose hydrolase
MRIAFRCDAAAAMGIGHLMRCLTLGDALRERGHETLFLLSPQSAPRASLADKRGHPVRILDLDGAPAATPEGGDPPMAHWLPWGWRRDAEAARASLPDGVDWIVVDHYGLDARWHQAMRPTARSILAIDDTADRPQDCDVLLDHNIGNLDSDRYVGLVPGSAIRLLGPRHALLRPAFAAARSVSRPRTTPERINILLSAHGSAGLARSMVEALCDERWRSFEVDVIADPGAPDYDRLAAAAAERPRSRLHDGAADIAALFAAAGVGIGAAGGAALERCCVGLPSVLAVLAPNQRPGALALARLGAAAVVEDEDATAVIAQLGGLVDDGERRERMARRGMALVDGLGAGRVADVLAGRRSAIALRTAVAADAPELLRWRNDPVTRENSLSGAPVDPATHAAWFAAVLGDPDRHLLIATSPNAPAGSVRFDRRGPAAVVSLMVSPEVRGRGLGSEVLAEGELRALARWPAIERFEALVKPRNAASIRLFEKAGYLPVSSAGDALLYARQV